jgi:hypothetical protein
MAGVKRFPSAFHSHRRTRFAVPCNIEPAKQIADFSEATSLIDMRRIGSMAWTPIQSLGQLQN